MMNPLKTRRIRTVVIAGAALAAVAATGLVVANTSRAADSRWVTATATTGDVTQTYTATGSITRTNTEKVAFGVSGTVNAIKVGVGDQVTAGQVLATIDTRALKLALLQAETTVAQAELNLYNAQHPSSASSSAKRASSSRSSSGSAGTGSSTSGKTSGLTTVTLDLTKLNQTMAAVNLAVVDEAKQCDAIMAWVNEEVTAPTTTTATTSDGSSTSPSSASVPSSSAPTGPASASASPSAGESAAAEVSATPSASASATQYASVPDPTADELKACATARAQLNTANASLQTLMAAINAAANPNDDNSSPSAGSGSGSGSSGSSSSSATVSASAVDSAKASLLQANQKLQTAQDNLDAAELVAPISGTVGTITLSEGSSAGSGSITIVGGGDAVVTIEVPLKTRSAMKVGQAVQVTPAGSTQAMGGKITNISLVETSGTAGSSPTYATTVGVSDPKQLLATGAKASVTIPVTSVTGVVTVPASAVTPTGTGTATVLVLSADGTTTTTTTVTTGAVGGGRVQITGGISAGQVVVLADNTAAIPSNQSNRRTTTTSGSTSRSSSSAPASSATTQPTSEPTR